MMPFLTWSLGVGVDPVEISQTSLPFVDFLHHHLVPLLRHDKDLQQICLGSYRNN